MVEHSREPEIDDITYIIDQLIQVRDEAIHGENHEIALYTLTDDLQSMIEYFTDYFGLEPR